MWIRTQGKLGLFELNGVRIREQNSKIKDTIDDLENYLNKHEGFITW